MRDLPSIINCVSFFTGGGGLERGLRQALGDRLRCIAYVERDAYCVENLISKIEADEMDAAPIFTDVTTFPAEQFRGLVDIFTGGYPCQPESVAGKRGLESDPRHLWPYCRDFIETVRPLYCYFENVRGHVNGTMVNVLRELAELQYAVEPGIFSAEECGGSHSRERVFILARDMANTDRRLPQGWGPMWREEACGRAHDEFTGSGFDLAHPNSPRRSQPQGSVRELGGWAVNGVEKLEHTEGIGCGTWRPEHKGEQGRSDVAESGGELADAYNQRLQECRHAREAGGEAGGEQPRPNAHRNSCQLLPQSPPGPTDADGWYRVLFYAPYLAPSLRRSEAERIFRRVADGLADESHLHELRSLFCENRVDRLRMLGNGVYPWSAAVAFVVLMEKMMKNILLQKEP